LVADWPGVESDFKSVILDITAIQNAVNTSSLEGWFEILSKIMKMWQTSSETLNQTNLSQKPESQADDFYVFIYDDLDS